MLLTGTLIKYKDDSGDYQGFYYVLVYVLNPYKVPFPRWLQLTTNNCMEK